MSAAFRGAALIWEPAPIRGNTVSKDSNLLSVLKSNLDHVHSEFSILQITHAASSQFENLESVWKLFGENVP